MSEALSDNLRSVLRPVPCLCGVARVMNDRVCGRCQSVVCSTCGRFGYQGKRVCMNCILDLPADQEEE